ncbi:MAG: hypothetical protein DRR08_15720 [Candidatus Parabeggiatoa sp. nov. 2]|nr:MAG: hypothetical protein DRR08_15720 [Gammaproteobacteria bacterium]
MFEIAIHVSEILNVDEIRDSAINFETTESMIMSICSVLDELDCCSFNVCGFGDTQWPVDVCTDMSVFLEQLNPALKAIYNADDFELDFYEQGIERRVSFSFDSGCYHICCVSGTNWEPLSESDMDIEAIKSQLVKVKAVFVALSQQVFPVLSQHSLFARWNN